MRPESKILLPNVDEVLDIGWAMHVADDPALDGPDGEPAYGKKQAQVIVDRFRQLQAPPHTAEDAWLRAAQAIALSLGRGITRRKDAWKKELESAANERQRRLDRIKESRESNQFLALAWKLAGPVALGLLGFLVAKVVGYLFVSDDISQQTGTKLPAVLVGLVFVFVGRSLGFFWADTQRNTIEVEFRARCYHADLDYSLGKLQELNHYRTRLCEAWREYTHEEFPETASYRWVLAGDIETRRKLEEQIQLYDRTALWYFNQLLRLLRRRKGSSVEFSEAKPTG